MTVWIAWAPENDLEVRAAYNALGIGETIQISPETVTGGFYLAGSSVITIEQARSLPHVAASDHRRTEWVSA